MQSGQLEAVSLTQQIRQPSMGKQHTINLMPTFKGNELEQLQRSSQIIQAPYSSIVHD